MNKALPQSATQQFSAWENPMGTDGFEFIEYAAPDPKAMGELFERMGFKPIARHRHKRVLLYRQGGINFIINAEPDSFAHAECDRADARPVLAREALREGIGLGVDDEVDLPLAIQQHVLVAVPRNRLEAHALEDGAHGGGVGCGVLDELEAVGAHRVVPGGELHDLLRAVDPNLGL